MRDVFTILQPWSEHSDLIRGSRHAAAIVYKGMILAIGNNKLKTHPIMKKYGKNDHSIFLHAEIDAIVKTINKYGDDILRHSSLYVMRTTKGGKISNSAPCPGCQRAIKAFKIKKVIHT